MLARILRMIDGNDADAIVSRKRFSKAVARQLSRKAGVAGALLYVRVECLVDAGLLRGDRSSGALLSEMGQVIQSISPGCVICVAASDALVVFVGDLTHGIDVAEAMAQGIHESIAFFDGDEDEQLQGCDGASLVSVAVGATRLGGDSELNGAIDVARSLAALVRQGGGHGVRWNAPT